MVDKTGTCPSIDKEYFHIKEWKNFIQTFVFAKHKISSILQSYNNAIFLPKVSHSSGKTKKTSIQIHTYDFCYLYLKVRVFLKVFMFPLCSCFLNLDVPKFFDMTRLFMLRMMRTKSYILFNVRKSYLHLS